jgi:glycosyl hydrolase family 113
MKKLIFPILLILTLPFTFLGSRVEPLDQRGMSLGLFSKEPNYSYLKDLQELKDLGVNSVLLVVSWYQRDIHSTEIVPREYDGNDILTLPDSKLREVIRQAHSLGLHVLVFPILRLEIRNEKDWRGVIDPSDLGAWWKSYEKFTLHYAEVSASEGVELFSVGSELLSREEETGRWEDLIEKIKKVYPGKLLYSANWDHYQHPHFWKSLDYIGITAYHELSKTKTPTLSELKKKWQEIQKELLTWKKNYPDRKLIFTEIGYPSIDGTSVYPWNYYLEGDIDIEEQALCYRAFIDSWKKSKDLSGVFFWVWWGEGGPQDKSYTPRGKPAAAWLKKWYKSAS